MDRDRAEIHTGYTTTFTWSEHTTGDLEEHRAALDGGAGEHTHSGPQD